MKKVLCLISVLCMLVSVFPVNPAFAEDVETAAEAVAEVITEAPAQEEPAEAPAPKKEQPAEEQPAEEQPALEQPEQGQPTEQSEGNSNPVSSARDLNYGDDWRSGS